MSWSTSIRGCAYGDAWGYLNEFKSYEQLTRDSIHGPNLPARLTISDDTQMSLSLARALHHAGTARDDIQAAIIDEWIEWRHDPDNYRAPGATCISATNALSAGHPWTQATVPTSNGCGTVMRVSAAAYLPDNLWRPVAAWQAASTHGGAQGIAASLVAAALIRDAEAGGIDITRGVIAHACELLDDPSLRGGVAEWLVGHPAAATAAAAEQLLDAGLDEMRTILQPAAAFVRSFRKDPWADDPCEYTGAGWRAGQALATALLCIDALPDQPIDALRRATVTGGDSDSIAAIAGSLLGALYDDPWPHDWEDLLEDRYFDWIRESDGYFVNR